MKYLKIGNLFILLKKKPLLMSFSKLQIGSTIVMMIIFQISRFIDQKDPKTINILRVFYLTSQIATLLVYYTIQKIVEKKEDKRMVDVKKAKFFMSPEEQEVERISVKDYDLREIRTQMKSIVTGVVLLFFLHFKFGFVQPLFVQAISPIRAVLISPLTMIHLYGLNERNIRETEENIFFVDNKKEKKEKEIKDKKD